VFELAINTLAGRQADWLAVRQNVIAENIANSNTPAYEAKDVVPFSATLEKLSPTLAQTSPGHIDLRPQQSLSTRFRSEASSDVTHSGNSVNIPQQLLKANDVRAAYSVNVGIVRAFNRLLLVSVRGQP